MESNLSVTLEVGFRAQNGAQRAPFDTICLNRQAPRFRKGDVWENQIRRKRNRQNLFVIQIIGPARLRVK